MAGLWVAVGLIVVVLAVGTTIVVTYLRRQDRRSIRNTKFRQAILEQENVRDAALLRDKNSPDAYIAQRSIERIKQRYTNGDEEPV